MAEEISIKNYLLRKKAIIFIELATSYKKTNKEILKNLNLAYSSLFKLALEFERMGVLIRAEKIRGFNNLKLTTKGKEVYNSLIKLIK